MQECRQGDGLLLEGDVGNRRCRKVKPAVAYIFVSLVTRSVGHNKSTGGDSSLLGCCAVRTGKMLETFRMMVVASF